MLKSINHIVFFMAVAFLAFTGGCGEKREEIPDEDDDEINETIEESETDTTETENILDITGTWRGDLEGHPSTLRITEQDGLNFKGKISADLREPFNRNVSGKINPEEKTLTMSDQVSGRYEGSYYAKFSENMNSMRGTFTFKHEETKWNFNYKK